MQPKVNKYQYVDNAGSLKTIEAETPELAISTAKDRAPNSGVALVSNGTTSNGVQQTDTAYRAQTQENVAKMQGLTAQVSAGNSNTGISTDTTQHNPITDSKGNTVAVWNTNMNGYRDLATGGKYTPPKDNTTTGISTPEDKTADWTTAANKEIESANSVYDSISAMSSQASQNLISSIKQIYGSRIAAMEESNRRSERTQTTLGLRTGRARYAPTVQSGILTAEERDGIQRIATLQGAMLEAIAGAEQAQAENSMKIFNSRMEQVDKIEKELQTKIMDQHKMAVDAYNADLARDKEARAKQKENLDNMLSLSSRSAPAVFARLSSYKTADEKLAFLQAYSKKTGIDLDILLSDVEDYNYKSTKQDLELANIRSQIEKRNNPPQGDEKMAKENDIAEAILRFQDQIKSKGWKGINPDEYEYYKQYLRDTYGASAVLELDKAIEEAGLEIDIDIAK